ncbi:MAG: LytTR family transcriptional regulator [Pedobacter sp.]|nr:MAG: LytTR family transcriptional regulator [Pedobacter sp.]
MPLNKALSLRSLQLIFYLLVIPYASHFLISIRERDTLIQRVQNPYYWIAFGYTLAVCYAFAYIISRLSARLDKKQQELTKRIIHQTITGVLLPLIGVTALATIYYAAFGENIIKRGYLQNELPIVLLFLLAVNAYHLTRYLNQETEQLKKSFEEQSQQAKNNTLLVYHKGAHMPITFDQIAMIDQVQLINWIVTFEKERHILELSLKEACSLLDKQNFFQINRNQIINRKAIHRFSPGTFGKLELFLNINQNGMVTVSKDRVKNFKNWVSI